MEVELHFKALFITGINIWYLHLAHANHPKHVNTKIPGLLAIVKLAKYSINKLARSVKYVELAFVVQILWKYVHVDLYNSNSNFCYASC